ncbi:MAG TPA: DNA-directed RNA polymerase subunit beta', partial [Phycisphaerae bacterium]|nr:DNA-directed RNA polymerase subunit beta' [Phycisphaerae bacterium]
RCRRPVQGTANRPLKSLTDMIKGKQGRFRENLLGKRVDYSGRSVIVVGPELKLNQCGLPKKIALELFQPFIIRKLKERGLADTIKSAKKMLERRDQEIWDVLEEVIYQHPVMLNRAPTLHRMGIQAFEPILVEGNAIRVHPLVCKGFNADFDGDQMAVHLPLSVEAQTEAHVLMLATNNIFSPANGSPMMAPTQDMVLGIYYLTSDRGKTFADKSLQRVEYKGDKYPVFCNLHQAITAHAMGRIGMHALVLTRVEKGLEVHESSGTVFAKDGRIITTVGRMIFNDILPKGIGYYNYPLGSKGAGKVISNCYERLGRAATLELLDNIKSIGFRYSTLAGLSFGITDARIPDNKKEIIDAAQKRVDQIQADYEHDAITEGERTNQIVDVWIHAREEVTGSLFKALKEDKGPNPANDSGYLNPVFLMTDSGARGKIDQIRQLAGMRGLMSKPSGEIIETPIKANFREGLNVLEYFSSTHGARKGLADTALKTADSGYLTRKLADVAQNVIVNEIDCGTLRGVKKVAIYKGEQIDVPLRDLIIGRVARETIADPVHDRIIVKENQIITAEAAKAIEELGIEEISVRSPLTCESPLGCCAKCYGLDMSTGRMVEEGMAVGIIAAQSIGEPGTQLTMRTFHTGGTATRAVIESEWLAPVSGKVVYRELGAVPAPDNKKDFVALKRQGEIAIVDEKNRELEKYKVSYGSHIVIADGGKVKAGQRVVWWD